MVDGGWWVWAGSTVCIFVVFSLQKLERVEEWYTFKLTRKYIVKKYVQSKGDLLK
jgi:hypothetical protein